VFLLKALNITHRILNTQGNTYTFLFYCQGVGDDPMRISRHNFFDEKLARINTSAVFLLYFH
jgi:hypothetical protein